MNLSREEGLKALGLWPFWRLRSADTAISPSRAEVAPTSPSAGPLPQETHSRGSLPHVKADAATYFVTLRLADSLPAALVESWEEVPEGERARNVERYLDQGAGECWLGRPEIAQIVVQALQSHAHNRYILHEYAVMPNHVHLLLTPLGEYPLSELLQGVKSWSTHAINECMGRSGPLWQDESYDRVVRDDDELQALAAYVRRNPVKAGLCAEEADYRWSSACKAAPPALLSPVATMDWDELRASIQSCTRCDLHKSRTQGVFGVGDLHAEWLFVGEAPGAEEDRQGEPFVGQAGKLLDAMLGALGLKRGDNVYIANVLKSRPPGNRDPLPTEVAACLPYLERQIDLIRPRIIVAVGRIAAQNLLATDTPIGKLRGHVHTYRGVPLVVTYHPAYLLRSPADKARAWEDLVLALNTMRRLK